MNKIFQKVCGYGYHFHGGRQVIPKLTTSKYPELPYYHKNSVNRQVSRSRTKMTNETGEITIATHNGVFHCDEILACFMLQTIPKYKNAKIIRTRDETVISSCNIVVDVGSIFDVESNRFDHHQRTFQSSLSSLRPELGDKWKIRLSSAGLVYTYFGEQVIQEILKENNVNLSADAQKKIYLKVYEGFVEEIDAIDNGVPMFDIGEPLYRIHTCLSSRVSHFNSDWNTDISSYNEQEQFEKAKQMVGNEFIDKVLYFSKSWWPARSIVENAVDKRFDTHKSGEILEFQTPCPWKDHLDEIEREKNIVGQPKYVLFENKPGDNRVMCVPKAPKSFVCRKFLHKSFRGIRTDELIAVSGVADANFCHATGFIGGALSRDGAFQMAVKSLEASEDGN